MEEKVYLEKLDEIKKEAELKKRLLQEEYAFSNAKFKVGDLITNEIVTFVVDNITIYTAWDVPEVVYHGFELKKDLAPRKDGNRARIYGSGKITLISKDKNLN